MNNSYAEFDGLNSLYHKLLDLIKGFDTDLLITPLGFNVFLEIERLRGVLWNRLRDIQKVNGKYSGSTRIVVARIPHKCSSCRKPIHKNDRFYKTGSSKREELCVKCGTKRYGVLHSYNIQRY